MKPRSGLCEILWSIRQPFDSRPRYSKFEVCGKTRPHCRVDNKDRTFEGLRGTGNSLGEEDEAETMDQSSRLPVIVYSPCASLDLDLGHSTS